MEGYITFTTGNGGAWIAWHTLTKPPEDATGRDLMNSPSPVQFAVGATSESALERLRADLSTDHEPRSQT